MIIYDLTQATDLNDYYRSFLTGNADKDQPILQIMRQRNNHKTVSQLADMMEGNRDIQA